MTDPAALAVTIARLSGVAEEMGSVLRRAASSPNIKERADCSAAVFDGDGHLLAQAEHIPVHLGSMPASVAAAIAAVGAEVGRGDNVILNDPFAGGTHLNDITVMSPVFGSVGLVGWVANRAHHADVGGMVPGSIPPEAVEIQQEGLRIPPVLLTREVEALLLAASRTPEERRGDLAAQVGANRIGAMRLAELVGAEGASWDEVLAYGERRMRAALASVGAGQWAFEDIIDSCGPRPEQRRPAVIRLTLTVADDAATFDFSASDDQRAGNVNAVESVTVSAVAFALRSVLDPTMPANGGAMRPVRIVTRAGSIVAASSPAAVGAGNVEVSQRVADVCLGALAFAVPGAVGAASQGTMNNTIIGGAGWVYYETVGGGQGGRPPSAPLPAGRVAGLSGVEPGMINTVDQQHRSVAPRPGQSGIHTGMTNTLNTPTEALERAFPLRVRRYGLRRGSGGRGLAPGGEGIIRELEVLEDCTLSLITERRVSHPWGLAGGEPGACGENWLLPGGDETRPERMLDKCTVRLRAGDVVRVLTPGGGGWGSPAQADGALADGVSRLEPESGRADR